VSEPEPRASDADRDRARLQLRDAAADGRSTVDGLDERLEPAYAARTTSELDGLTRALGVSARASPPRTRRRLVAIISETALRGRVRLRRPLRVIAIMGAAVMDPRDAELVDGELTVRVLAIMGGRGSSVPPGPAGAPRVRVTGLVLWGAFGAAVRPRRTIGLDPGAD
jgi:hypothetical protein